MNRLYQKTYHLSATIVLFTIHVLHFYTQIKMYSQLIAVIVALATTPLVSAHGEILSAVGE